MNRRTIVLGLAVVAVVLLAYAAWTFRIDAGNKRVLFSVAATGVLTTIAAWLWARRTPQT
jgi:hypothetical protein